MARQCIYCGRSLQPGELCSCRSGAAGSQPGAGTAPGTAAGAGPAKSAESAKSSGSTKSSGPKASRARSTRTRTGWAKTARGGTAQSRRTTRPGSMDGLALRLQSLFKQYTRFLRAPIDTALDFADDPGYAGILLLVGSEAVAAAILAAVGTRSNVFYLSFAMLGLTMQGASSAWTAALLAAVQSFVRLGLLSGVMYLYLRFIVKTRTGFQAVAAAVAPACAPMAGLMLLACLPAGTATSSAPLTLVLGMLAGVLLMFFTFRRLVGLSDNQTLLMLLFGHLLYYSILSLLVGSFALLG